MFVEACTVACTQLTVHSVVSTRIGTEVANRNSNAEIFSFLLTKVIESNAEIEWRRQGNTKGMKMSTGLDTGEHIQEDKIVPVH